MLLLALGLASTFGCSDFDKEDSQEFRQTGLNIEPTNGRDGEKTGPVDEERLVYQRHEVRRDGKVVSLKETGTLTAELVKRAQAPWLHIEDTGSVIVESEELRSIENDTAEERIYSLYSINVDTRRNTKSLDTRPLEVDEDVLNEKGERSYLNVKLRDTPVWQIPPPIDRTYISTEDADKAELERTELIRQRANNIETLSNGLRRWTESVGGKFDTTSLLIGWLKLDIPTSQLDALLQRADIVRVTSAKANSLTPNACITSPTCNLAGAGTWRLGEGRVNERLGVDEFWWKGYSGAMANPTFHGDSRLNVAVLERGAEDFWEDEALWWNDYLGSSRISRRVKCVTSPQNCADVVNFNDATTGNSHPTMVGGIIAADLLSGQAYGSSMGDTCWSGGGSHCADWENASTGIARHVNVQMFAAATTEYTLDNAILNAIASSKIPDVMNLSTSHKETNRCNPTSSYTFEDAIEAAYQTGVLVVNGPDNVGSVPQTGACNLDSPGDLPTSFTVNGFASASSNCQSDYQQCVIDGSASARGGIDVTVSGLVRSRAMSGIDLQAPGRITFRGSQSGNDGTIITTNTGGTSIAAPHVSGAAALVKHWLLATGRSWVNSPGRLHTVMLSMGDRHRGTVQSSTGFDYVHGAGKLKLRPFWNGSGIGAWGNHIRTATTTSVGLHTYYPFSQPLPSGTENLKCVMQEHEYMANKTDVSDQYLQVTLRDSSGGSCTSPGNPTTTSFDASYDLKHMVAIEGQSSLVGQCVEVTIHRMAISSAGSASASVFCTYTGIGDNEPN
ncbi:S8/S53 family peptidase [Microvenator marinus]|nr:S8/S53 family peptidase [Microvenator marinus]